MCQNPYLSLAIVAAASLEGIKQKLNPGKPIERSLYDVSDAELAELQVEALPNTLLHAIQTFDGDLLAKDVPGETMHRLYSQHKHSEWARFHEHVSEWEQKEYLRFY
jgi:glutamine synthetase